MKEMKKIIPSIAICCLMCGCATSPSSPENRPYSQTVGPFAPTYAQITQGMTTSLAAGDTNALITLSENIAAMTAFSLWAFYPTNGTFTGTADRQFTEYVYSSYESDFTHWKRVMLFGSPTDKTVALQMMKFRTRSLVNGYPFSAERNRTEDIAFASIMAMMSEYILADLVPLVKQNLSQWPSAGQTVGLCVLAHAGDQTAREKLKTLNTATDRTVIGIYRTTSHTKEGWPHPTSEGIRQPVDGSPKPSM